MHAYAIFKKEKVIIPWELVGVVCRKWKKKLGKKETTKFARSVTPHRKNEKSMFVSSRSERVMNRKQAAAQLLK